MSTPTTTPRKLREYQTEAHDSVISSWGRDTRRTAIVLPTGSGKSTIIAKLASTAHAMNLPVLLLSHRGELLRQMADAVAAVDPSIPPVGIVQADRDECTAPIVGATLQTLGSERRRNRIGNRPVILFDECHHSGAKSWLKTLEALGLHEGAFFCGFTATMRREDGVPLRSVIEEVAYERDLRWAFKQGYLVKPHGLTVRIPDLDLSKVHTVAGDFHQTELAEVMEASISSVADAILRFASDRRLIIFAASVAGAQHLAEDLTGRGYRTEAITGDMHVDNDREPVYERFRSGETRAMVTVAVLTEGADFPMCDGVVIACPTQSQLKYCFDRDTEILTETGWQNGMDIDNNVKVAAFDPVNGGIEWQKPTAYIKRELYPNERMVSIKSPTVDIRVTENHRMIWKPVRDVDFWRITEAGTLVHRRTGYRIPVAGSQKSEGIALTPAEVAFIGWVETDGCINKNNYVIQISQQDPENCLEIERVLTECGFKWRMSINSKDTNFGPRKYPLHIYRVSKGKPRGEDTHLRGWGDLEKYIPKASVNEALLLLDGMDSNQLSVFLDAMHRANGSKYNGEEWTRRGYHICTSRKYLVDWLQSLCVRRGWRANIAVEKREGEDIYTIHCRNLDTRTIGGCGAKDRKYLTFSPNEHDEHVWCVTVPTGSVVIRRNGKVSVSGNCQMVGRCERLYDGKTDALVLDLVGVTRVLKLVTVTDLDAGIEVKQVEPDGTEIEDPDEPPELSPGTRSKVVRQGVLDMMPIDLLGPDSTEVLWLTTMKGTPFFTVPEQDTAVFLWPRASNKWQPGHVTTKGTKSGGWIDARAWDIETARNLATDWVMEQDMSVSQRSAKWRNQNTAPTEKQLKFGRDTLHIPDADTLTKGRLSDEITRRIVSNRLDLRSP